MSKLTMERKNQRLLKLVVIFFIIILVLALLMAPLVSNALKNNEEKRNLLYHYNSQVNKYNSLNLIAEKGKTVFLGDSLVEYYDTDEYFPEVESYNRGISGDKTKGIIDRIEGNVLNIFPKTVVLEIGTNDIGAGVSEDKIIQNLTTILDLLIENGVSEIILVSLFPINVTKIFKLVYGGKRDNKSIVSLNEKYKQLALSKGAQFVDCHSHLVDEDGNLNINYTKDGLHLNAVGYDIITKLLAPMLVDGVEVKA